MSLGDEIECSKYTNLQEYKNGTDPSMPEMDGLMDSEESRTAIISFFSQLLNQVLKILKAIWNAIVAALRIAAQKIWDAAIKPIAGAFAGWGHSITDAANAGFAFACLPPIFSPSVQLGVSQDIGGVPSHQTSGAKCGRNRPQNG
jgi:hypothetical protein